MAKYIVSSDGPISVHQISYPDPGSPDIGLPGDPEYPSTGFPGLRPGQGLPPHLPPISEWPPLPPFLQPGVGLPIPPTPEYPMVPVEPDPEAPEIWPPVRPEFPDLSGKSLALELVFVSRHVARWHWIVIDHADAKAKWQAIKGKLPAGGVAGRPPNTRPPAA
jgi:hypothetical protein